MSGLYIVLGGICLAVFVYLILYARIDAIEAQIYASLDDFLSKFVKEQSSYFQELYAKLEDIKKTAGYNDELIKKVDSLEDSITKHRENIEDCEKNVEKENPTE